MIATREAARQGFFDRFASWLGETKLAYLGNAAALRDFRVQLRGNRSMLLFGLYLAVMIGAGLVIYAQTANAGQISALVAQNNLLTFYAVVIGMLGAVLTIVTPALSATAVVMERQRHSLDLVFSAPVTARYYLVGKMISAFRYTWMLLILSLPVTASCVVLGGASWSDVLESFGLLSMHALIITAISLLVSTMVSKPVSAIIWSYAATAAYLIPATALSAGAMNATNGPFHMEGIQAPFWGGLSPYTVSAMAGTYSSIGGLDVPNWILVGGLTLLICRLLLLGAGVALASWDPKLIVKLRSTSLVYAAVLAAWVGYAVVPSASSVGDLSVFGGSLLAGSSVALLLAVPNVCCFGKDAERRLRPNGWFSSRRMLDGTPAGALPFLLALVSVGALGLFLGTFLGSGLTLGMPFLVYVCYGAALVSLFWAVARYTSSYMLGVRTARVGVIVSMIVLLVLPTPILSALTPAGIDSEALTVWDLFVLRPIGATNTHRVGEALAYAVLLLAATGIFAAWAEKNLKEKNSGDRPDGPIVA